MPGEIGASADTAGARQPHRVVHELRRMMAAEAEDWGVRPWIAELVFLVPYVGAAALAVTTLDPLLRLFYFLASEDRVLEWLQVLAYASASVFSLLIARRLLAAGRRPTAGLYFLVALGSLFVFGEELSWGQRLFGLETPESLEEVNYKGEINIHNIVSIRLAFRLSLVFVGAYGALVPWLVAYLAPRSPRGGRLQVWVPPLFLSSFFFCVFCYFVVRLAVNPQSLVVVTFSEWPESCLALSLALFTYLLMRRLADSSGSRLAVSS